MTGDRDLFEKLAAICPEHVFDLEALFQREAQAELHEQMVRTTQTVNKLIETETALAAMTAERDAMASEAVVTEARCPHCPLVVGAGGLPSAAMATVRTAMDAHLAVEHSGGGSP